MMMIIIIMIMMMMMMMMLMMMMMMMIASPWLETSSWWQAGTERLCPLVDSDSFREDSEVGQMLTTCGKLSNKAPSVKVRHSSFRLQL